VSATIDDQRGMPEGNSIGLSRSMVRLGLSGRRRLVGRLSRRLGQARPAVLIGERLPWILWGMTVAQVAFGLSLAVLNRLDLTRFFAEYVVSVALAAVTFATVGAMIVTRRRDNTTGWLFCVAGAGFGWGSWLNQYARYALLTAPGSLPAGELILWLNLWSGTPVVLLVAVYLPLLFPDGRLPSPRWRPVAWLAAAATVLLSASFALGPGPIDSSQPDLPNPFAPVNAGDILAVVGPLAGLLTALALFGGAGAAVVRFRRAQGIERQQLKWFAYATVVLLFALVMPILLYFPDFTSETLLSGVLLSVGFPAIPLATGTAILRYRLYEIDRLISRTVLYGVLTACVVVFYAFIVGYLSLLFRTADDWLISLVATGLVAVLFQPLRARLQEGVNRLIYGARDDPYGVMSRLGQQLQLSLAPDQVLPAVVAAVQDALKLPYVAIALEHEGSSHVASSRGQPVGEVLRLPLVHGGETVGSLLVSPRDPEATWSIAEQRLLGSLGAQAGAAVHNVRLTEGLQHLTVALQEAREQLVLAREEERRRLRHDLHDELAPTLASLALTAATARALFDTDPGAAKSLVGDLQGALRACVGDVRRLAYNLRPPVLDELGLLAAIAERARQYDGAPVEGEGEAGTRLRVVVEAPDALPPLPAAVEVAAYRIVSEAVMNVARHAQAHTCTIRLAFADQGRRLEIEVVDDGHGLPEEYRAGVGLRSMRERAAELGGACVVEPRARGGTVVRVWLPLTERRQEMERTDAG
jgi:signal transduction histidine kinase